MNPANNNWTMVCSVSRENWEVTRVNQMKNFKIRLLTRESDEEF